MTSKMAAKIRFLDEYKCLYNIYIFELLMHTYSDQLGQTMTYCRSGNIRENLIFANIRELVSSRIQSSRE